MSGAIRPFDPNSFICSRGEPFDPSCRDKAIVQALADLRLEDAKNRIYQVYGSTGAQPQVELKNIIFEIVELNKSTLTPEHQQLNYTLDAAYGLACHIYTLAVNDKVSRFYVQYLHATQALQAVADAYAAQGNRQKVIDTLNRLQPACTAQYVDEFHIQPTLARLKKDG